MGLVAGVDGCKGGWVAALQDGDAPLTFESYRQVADLLHAHPELQVVAIDIPIGCLAFGDRQADRLARAILGPRKPSLFPTPTRAALGASSYTEANQLARQTMGKGLSRQSWALRQKILEVDALDDPRLHEFHPEVTFTALQPGPMTWSKQTWNGLLQRYELLHEHGIGPCCLVETEIGPIAPADVIDATAGVWTARRIAEGMAHSLGDPDERSDQGRPIRIWY